MSKNCSEEKDSAKKKADTNVIERPHPVLWRIIHSISFLIGGTTFIAGSCMYFADVIVKDWALNVGASLFIVGSFAFLCADLQDWWYHRVGLACDCKYRELYEQQNAATLRSQHSLYGTWKRAEPGLNVTGSVLGSTFYLIGSVFFLPDLVDYLQIGEGFFIAGSAVIFFSQIWKVIRIVRTNKHDPYDSGVCLMNLLGNIVPVIADTAAGLGGFFYFIGTILFLPKFIQTDAGINRAAALSVTGGCFFTLAGIFLVIHYFCTREEEED